jgi:GT2 family glycosyltransferase
MLRLDHRHLDDTGDFYSTRGMPFPRGRNEIDKGQYDVAEPVFAASGGASLYRAALFQQIGQFDQDFFAYFEDVDLSFRAQLAGWKIWYEPKAVVYHHVNATSQKLGNFSRYHSVKNFIYTYNKNMPGWLFWKYKPLFTYQLLRMGLGALRDGQPGIYLKAVGSAALKIPVTLRKRRAIQRQRRLASPEIDALLYKQRPPKIPEL